MVSHEYGILKILDFGIARDRRIGPDAGRHASIGTLELHVAGADRRATPSIIAATSSRSAPVLYELLVYRQAFPGDNLATLTYRIVHGYARNRYGKSNPIWIPNCAAIVERAMSRYAQRSLSSPGGHADRHHAACGTPQS